MTSAPPSGESPISRRAVVEIDDLTHHRKAEALALNLLVGARAPLQNALAIRGWNPGAIILDTDAQPPAGIRSRQARRRYPHA